MTDELDLDRWEKERPEREAATGAPDPRWMLDEATVVVGRELAARQDRLGQKAYHDFVGALAAHHRVAPMHIYEQIEPDEATDAKLRVARDRQYDDLAHQVIALVAERNVLRRFEDQVRLVLPELRTLAERGSLAAMYGDSTWMDLERIRGEVWDERPSLSALLRQSSSASDEAIEAADEIDRFLRMPV